MSWQKGGYVDLIVDYRNSYLINHISLHDFEFKGIKHDYEKKYIELEIKKKSAETVPSSLSFQDVLYYEMTCCKFWGSGHHIICCNLMDTTNIYDKLLRLEQVEYAKSNSIDRSPMNLLEFIGVEIWLNSGDKLKVICKIFEFDDFLIWKVFEF